MVALNLDSEIFARCVFSKLSHTFPDFLSIRVKRENLEWGSLNVDVHINKFHILISWLFSNSSVVGVCLRLEEGRRVYLTGDIDNKEPIIL